MAATPNQFITPQTPKNGKVQILPADASNLKTVYTAGANGSKVTAVLAATNDGSANHDLVIGISNGGTFFILGTIALPLSAGGINTVPALNLLDANWIPGLPVDNDGQRYLLLINNDTLQVKSSSTVTAAKEIDLVAIASDF